MSFRFLNSMSGWAVILLSAIIIYIRFTMPFDNVIQWDVFGYYIALPAKFVYHDLQLKDTAWINHVFNQYHPSSTLYQLNAAPHNGHYMRYPIGPAVLSLPFFLIAHLYVLSGHTYAADGFSLPYQFAYCMAALFYTLVGLYFARKFLLRFFSDKLTAILIILIVLATNYLELTTVKNTLPHNYEFTLYAILLYYTEVWHKTPRRKYAIFIGLILGLITIVRANELIAVIIPALWGVYNKESLNNKLALLKQRKGDVWAIVWAGLIGISPQIIYWSYAAGGPIQNSYKDPGVGFEFLSPFTWKFLFGFRKGWFIYTPIMFFACIGFVNLYKKNRPLFWPFLVYSLVNLYLVSSWSCYWYAAGSFSARTQMSSYLFLALPLGYFLQWLGKNRMGYVLAVLLCLATISLNLFQHVQAYRGVLDGDRMTMEYYFRTFGKLSATDDDRKLLSVERAFTIGENMPGENNFYKTNIGNFDFEHDEGGDKNHYTNKIAHSGTSSLMMDSSMPYSPGIDIKYKDLTQKEYAWIRASVWMCVPKGALAQGSPLCPQLVVSFHHQEQPYKFRTAEPKEYDKWVKVSIEYMTPEVRNDNDNLKVFVWYQGKQPVYIDDLEVAKFEPK